MSNQSSYVPPRVWKWESESGGSFASINRPIAGATHEKVLPIGNNPIQLYSMATPNGVKITIMLEELLAKGIREAEYDAWLIKIQDGEQFSSGFVEVNPNSKIPALLDKSDGKDVPVFESGAILLYLAEKFGAFLPKDAKEKAKCLSWLFWQMGSAPYVGGGFGHFYHYAPERFEYPIDRFTMEAKRQLDVLDRHFSENRFICGGDYTIADMAIWPWYGVLVQGKLYDAAEFLDVASYKNLNRWTDEIATRDAVEKGRKVNRFWGDLDEQLHERHEASDFETKTQDKIEAAE